MNVLVLNCGSSSLKFQLIDTDLRRSTRKPTARWPAGRSSASAARRILTLEAEGQSRSATPAVPLRDHRPAVDYVLRWLVAPEPRCPASSSLADDRRRGPPRRPRRRDGSRAPSSSTTR